MNGLSNVARTVRATSGAAGSARVDMTVASAGQLTFALYVDDGWIFGAGPRIGGTEQPTYVSGLLQNPPPSSPLKGYPVVGAWNTTSHGGNVSLTVNFPAAGTYPIEWSSPAFVDT